MTRLSDLRKTADAAIGADGLDSAQVTTIATNAGIAVYTALDSLPSSGLTSGDQAWVESSGRLYISNGSGWYNIALVNASPTLTLDQSGTILMGGNNPLTITVTASATDADDNQNIISFSVESDGNMVGTSTTISQDSSVFTITAISEDSGGTAGDFTLTFKATDQIAVDNESLSFTLNFSTAVDSSAYTSFLMKAAGNGVDNNSITFLDSTNASIGFGETGYPTASSFSPYRAGGYSAWFDGANSELQIGSSSDFAFGTGTFTIEGWIYPELASTWQQIVGHDGYPSAGAGVVWLSDQNKIHWYQSGSTGGNMASAAINIHEWTHFAVVREGTGTNQTKLYVNGVQANTMTSSTNYAADGIEIGNNQTYDFYGYMRDIRIVKGSAVYTAAFTLPTEPLTAVTNTVLLAASGLPYHKDKSSSNHAITTAGTNGVATRAFGPYDQQAWAANSHGGSIYLEGQNDYITFDDVGLHGNDGAFTIEAWVYPTSINTNENCIYGQGDNVSVTNFFDFGYATDGRIELYLNNGGSRIIGGTAGDVEALTWNHVAVVRRGTGSNETTLFVNGDSAATGTCGTLNTPTSTGGIIGSSPYSSGNATRSVEGYLADTRISLSAVYTGAFTPPTQPLSQTGSKLLMNNKSDAKIYSATANQIAFDTSLGIVTDNTTRKWTGSSSVEFDNSANGLPMILTGANFTNDRKWWQTALASDFTFEGWFYLNTSDQSNMYLQLGANGGNWTTSGQQFLLYSASGVFYAQWNSGGSPTSATWTEPDGGAWFHYAIVNDGGTIKQFHNGASVSTDTSYNIDADYVSGGTWTARLGGYTPSGATYAFDGYMQDVRFTKGYARYTSAFTAPTAEFEL